MSITSYLPLLLAVLFLGAIGVALYRFWPPTPLNQQNISGALGLSQVILIGLALSVGLMAGLAIIYNFLGLSNQGQPLGLPEGSIRALIAFSMVLIFVCMAAFLYSGVNATEVSPGGKVTSITEAQLNELKTQFVVAYEPARKADGSVDADPNGRPLYNATYFVKRNKDADDFAKQIFTTLATIFVSVISFYFGSSVIASGVGAGATAAAIGQQQQQQSSRAQGGGAAGGAPIMGL